MRKLIPLFIINFCFTAIVVAQTTRPAQTAQAKARFQKLIDSIRKAHPTGRPWAFGNKFIFAFNSYGVVNPFAPNSLFIYPVEDTNLWQVQFLAKVGDKRSFDSLAKTHPQLGKQVMLPNSKILLGVKLNPLLEKYRKGILKVAGKKYPRYSIPDGSEAKAIAVGINPGNIINYRYHVVLNDSAEIVPWSTPKLEQLYGTKAPYGLLGSFKYPGKQVLVEVVNVKDYAIRDGVLFDWTPEQPPAIISFSARAYNTTFSLNDTRRGYSKHIDKATGLPTDLKFPAKSIDEMTFRFDDHDGTTYMFGVYDTGNAGNQPIFYQQITGDELILRKNGFLNRPGKYNIVISSGSTPGALKVTIPFEIRPPLPHSADVTTTPSLFDYADPADDISDFGDAGSYAVILLALTGIGFGIYYLNNKNKLRKAERARAMAAMQLKSVRAQLNPHFMFNALTSIQNLMNQQNTEGANHYLSKFAGLTRQVLKTSGQELISLNDELQLITDYLEMEQLRFGFTYSIDVDPKINKPNTEIPTMLLQPFIENAAKHGVSALQNKGEIKVGIMKDDRNLVITIQDNGPGFAGVANPNGGHGLKLSGERIKLLNQLYKDQPISLKVNIKDPGAKVIITLTDWV